jgi:SAM-dependent MidA family methyltransferase
VTQLSDRLQERIRAEGPMTFAAFMEAALYDPDDGFYGSSPVGEQGDFVTSPHVSSLFGRLVAAQVEEFWELLGRPDRFDVVEVGAGRGTLARQILQSLPSRVASGVRYRAIDRSPSARRALEGLSAELGRPVDVGGELGEVEPGLTGCLIANELLDNLPFHRVKARDEGVAELFVGIEGGDFVLTEGPPSHPALERLAPVLADGEEAVVNLQALEFLDQGSRLFRRGYVWLCDYGWVPGNSSERHKDFVHGYRRHRMEEDVLSEPGTRDITAGVDFAALSRHAEALGLKVWDPATQRNALLSLGSRRWDQEARTRQVRATADRNGLEAMRIYSERNRAAQLVDPMGLGAFVVLCLGVGSVPERPPLSVRPPG